MHCCALNAVVVGHHSTDCESQSTASCPNHRIVAHDQAGEERWCNFCGQDSEGNQRANPAGGWGPPGSRRH